MDKYTTILLFDFAAGDPKTMEVKILWQKKIGTGSCGSSMANIEIMHIAKKNQSVARIAPSTGRQPHDVNKHVNRLSKLINKVSVC